MMHIPFLNIKFCFYHVTRHGFYRFLCMTCLIFIKMSVIVI